MNMKQRTSYLILVMTLSLGGCVWLNTTPTQSNETTPVRPATTTLTPGATPKYSQTPTAIPTLSEDEARLRIQGLLLSNGDCRLPCLWGLTPRETSLQEALITLFPLTSLAEYTHLDLRSPDDVGLVYEENDLQIYVSIGLITYPDSNIINRINFDARALKRTSDAFIGVFDSSSFSEQVNYYLLANILNEYGRPESVRLSTAAKLPSWGPTEGGFELLLLYPDQGMLVKYTTQMQVAGTSVRGCFSNAHVEFELYPSGQRDTFFQALDSTFWPQYAPNRYRLLEEVTFMSLDEFYQTFRQPTNECLDTPASLWPVPD